MKTSCHLISFDRWVANTSFIVMGAEKRKIEKIIRETNEKFEVIEFLFKFNGFIMIELLIHRFQLATVLPLQIHRQL